MTDAPPAALESPFDLGGVNPRITLFTGPVVLHRAGESLAFDQGIIAFSCRPAPRIVFEGERRSEDEQDIRRILDRWTADRIEVPDLGTTGRLVSETVALGGDFPEKPLSLSARGEVRELSVGEGRGLAYVLFHVPNFSDFHGAAVSRGVGWSTDRIELRGGEWVITMDARHDYGRVRRELKAQGGYAFTHIGRLERLDGAAFTAEEALDLLRGLHWFLSFVQGFWVCPMLFEGRDENEKTAWRFWDAGKTDAWRGVFSWCDWTNWGAAREAFEGFMAGWRDEFMRTVLRTAVGQYVSANRPSPVEQAIIAAQSGLELLGWVRLVEGGQISASDWRNPVTTPAAKKIRMLLDLAGIDPGIPQSFTALHRLDPNWSSGPEVVAGVRNRLVHPRKVSGQVGWPYEVLIEAWLLVSRYLELCLLHLLGVTSGVRDRLSSDVWVGSIKAPPWAPEST